MKFKFKNVAIAAALLLTLVLTACGNQGNQSGTAQVASSSEKIILGNIITMDENKPRAEAVAVKDGVIVAVGTKEEVSSAVSDSAEVIDYKDQYIYPGFMDPHTHGGLAGFRNLGQATIPAELFLGKDANEQMAKIIKKYIEDNPGKDYYMVSGWKENKENPLDYTYLDAICADKPILLNTIDGHSMLLNSKAMEVFGVDDEFAKKYGSEMVHLNADGHPNGLLSEGPAINLLKAVPKTDEEMKSYLLDWQEKAFSRGFTAVGDAGVELVADNTIDAYKQLQEEGKLKLRTYGFLMTKDNQPDPVGKVKEAVKIAKEVDGEYFKVAGFKVFFDGVVEAHTAWLLDDYCDQEGYRGVQRFNDPEILTQMLVECQKNNLSVIAHSMGDGATSFVLDCIEDAQKITGEKDQRNLITHLQIVADKDKKRMADTNSIAGVAPLWTPNFSVEGNNEVDYLGQERSDNAYPIKSFIDNGAKIVFHSDYPVSSGFDVSQSIYLAEKRGMPVEEMGKVRGAHEAINRQQSLEALTTNVAYAFHAEDILGSITPGKIANFTVVDKDFLECKTEELLDAQIIATIVDGDIVYKKD